MADTLTRITTFTVIDCANCSIPFAITTEMEARRDRTTRDRKSTRLNSSHMSESRMPSSA